MFNFFLKLLSNIDEKYGGRKLYVKFCDGKYHWARLEEKSVYDATGRLIQEQTYTSAPYKYEYEAHLVKGYYLPLFPDKQTKLYSEDSKKYYTWPVTKMTHCVKRLGLYMMSTRIC